MTGGGTWRPGHDAQRKSALYALLRDPEMADAHADAYDELESRGWPTPAAKRTKKAAEPITDDEELAEDEDSTDLGDIAEFRAATADA